MPDSPVIAPETSPQRLFPRAHKSALGLAFGLLAGLGLFAITALHVVTHADSKRGLPLYLLSQFFQGYEVTWPGAFIGLAWDSPLVLSAAGFLDSFTTSLWACGSS